MAENETPKTQTPPEGTEFEPTGPLDTMEVEFDSAAGGPQVGSVDEAPAAHANASDTSAGAAAGTAKQLVSDATQKLSAFGGDKARAYAQDGQAKAAGLLDELAKLLQDAAGNVDDKLGEQYGNYARSAAEGVSGFSGKVKDKDIDELIADARTFVEKSPGVAISTAAALGFVLVRLVKSGLDANKNQA